MIRKLLPTEAVAHLFAGWDETLIWSCLQGEMGDLYGLSQEAPAAALAALGDFVFLAGQPQEALAAFLPPSCGETPLLIPQNRAWADCIEGVWGNRVRRFFRYAIPKDPSGFCRRKLEAYRAALPPGYRLCPLTGAWYEACLREPWSRDLVAQFPSAAAYERRGLGFLVVQGTTPVSGASSYSRYREGIEIEVDTHPDHRRKGLARAAAAALILRCLDRGWFPSWDAHTVHSLKLARSLGYQDGTPYLAYQVLERFSGKGEETR